MNGNALNLRSLFEEINEIGSSGFDVSDLMSALEEVRTTPEPEPEKKKKIKKIREKVEGFRRSVRIAEDAQRKKEAANLAMAAAAAAPAYPNGRLEWGGEGVPVYGTNYSVARGASEKAYNRPPPSRRSKAPARTTGRRNYRNNERPSRANELSTGYGNSKRAYSRNRKPANRTRNNRSEKTILNINTRPTGKKTIREQIRTIQHLKERISTDTNLYATNHYIEQYNHYKNLLRTKILSDEDRALLQEAVSILLTNPAVQAAAAAMPNNRGAAAMSNNSSGTAAAAMAPSAAVYTKNAPLPAGLFPKERTIEELLKIRDYMERRSAGPAAAAAAPRRNRSENFRRFLGMLYASAQYHISQLRAENDSLEAVLLHSGLQFLDELNANATRPASPVQRAEANAIIDELSGLFSSVSMGPAAPPTNNFSNL